MPSVLDKPFFRDELAAYAKVESIIWPNGPVCVHCGETKRISLMKGAATRPGLYKCYAVNAARIFLRTAEVKFPSFSG